MGGYEKRCQEEREQGAGGPRSRVCSRNTPTQPPIDVSGNFPAHGSAELPSTISPNCLELISKVLENSKNFKKIFLNNLKTPPDGVPKVFGC